MPELKKIAKGEARTLIEAAEANNIINAINGLLRMKISPGSMGKVVQGDDGTTIDLSPLDEYIKTLIQQAVNGNGKDPNNDGTSSNGGGGAGGGDFSEITNQINNILSGLRSASISLSCNSDGSITGTITIPV